MTPITAPADKRFLRAHVRPVRRRVGWRGAIRIARAGAVALVLALAAYRVGALMVTSNVLRIDRLTVRGTGRLSKGEVLAVIDGLRGQNILRADLAQARRQLLASPWVADAVLRKRLPASVDVSITERRPIGIGRLPGGHLFLIDALGTIIDEFGPKYAEFDLPMIDGLTPVGRSRVDSQRVDLAARVLASLAARPDLARRVSQIDVSDASDAVVLLETDGAMLRLGDRDFLERLQGYVDLAATLHERVAAIDYVDLRYGNHVFVGPSAKPAPAARAKGGR